MSGPFVAMKCRSRSIAATRRISARDRCLPVLTTQRVPRRGSASRVGGLGESQCAERGREWGARLPVRRAECPATSGLFMFIKPEAVCIQTLRVRLPAHSIFRTFRGCSTTDRRISDQATAPALNCVFDWTV
jgi:hypothetical protein